MDEQKIPPRKIKFYHSIGARLRGYFLAGVLFTAPISLTLYLTYVFLKFVDNHVTPLIPTEYNPNNYLPFSLPGLGLVIMVVFFILVGWLAKNFFGGLFTRIAEYIVHRLPIAGTIYKGLKQIFETVMTDQSQAFREVVMCEFPRKGVWALGFVTGTAKGELQSCAPEEEVASVLIPATPPTSSFMLFVPRRDLIVLDMPVEDAVKMIVSGGLITPPDRSTK